MDAGTLHFNIHIEDKFIHKLFYLKRWSAQPVKLLSFISDVPMSNFSWDTNYPHCFQSFLSPSGKCQVSTYNWASTTSFHILSSSWFTECASQHLILDGVVNVLQNIQDGCGAHQTSYSMAARVSFHRGKVARAWSSPLTSTQCQGEEVELYLYSCNVMAWTGTT